MGFIEENPIRKIRKMGEKRQNYYIPTAEET
jgi:hypothetical protein